MRILYANWRCFGASDIIEAFYRLNHVVIEVEITDACHYGIDWDFVEVISQKMKKEKIDMIFSFNFFPSLSEACYIAGRRYLAWVYDSPSIKVYFPSIVNQCNCVFIFDRAVVEELKQKGVDTVHYAPLAVNADRLSKLKGTVKAAERYSCQIGFVGSLYNEKHHLYERLQAKAENPYLLGYLEGIMEAQLKVYGYNFLQECLTENIVNSIYQVMPVEPVKGALTNREYIYADYFLCRRMACLERGRTLELLSRKYQVYHYTNDAQAQVGKVINKGKVDYYDEMPLAFRYAKINLNMTLRSIKTGIPLRAMDILGARGFLLTNYQEDFLLHFEPDKDFVYYGSLEELEEKVQWYLEHDAQRQEIAQNGHKKVKENHSYTKGLERMFKYI